MNERIKELEKQAWDCVDQTWDWANPDNPSKVTLFKTKFAELIVRECADFVSSKAGLQSGLGIMIMLKVTGEQLKEHFGVE